MKTHFDKRISDLYKNRSIKRLCLILLSVFGYFILCIKTANAVHKETGSIDSYMSALCHFLRSYVLFILLPSLLFLIAANLTQPLGSISHILSRLGAVCSYLSGAVLTSFKTGRQS